VILTIFTGVCTVQILKQVWAPEIAETPHDCRDGLGALIGAVERARQAAAKSLEGERIALTRFRRALEPEWEHRAALSERCKKDAFGLRSLKIVDRLRYAEEHAVRYESADLARLRESVAGLEAELESGDRPH
jgi:hypothetical protein